MEQSGLTIRAFGPMEVTVEGRAIRTRTPKDLKLLAYLLYRHDSEQQRIEIAKRLWYTTEGDSSLGHAGDLTLLVRTLSALGAGLGSERWRIKKPTPQTLLLDTAGADIDFTAWNAAIHGLDAKALEHAGRLYQRGIFLEGWEDTWVLEARAQIEHDYQNAWERLAEHAMDQGEATDAQQYLQKAMDFSPSDQALWCKMMKVLASARKYNALSRLYEDFRKRCAKYDIEFEAETRRCFVTLRRAAEHFENSPESGVLPHPPSHFVAREADIRTVSALLDTHRLITLTGTGGIGKSRLAIEVARNVREDYYDRAWFIDLSKVTEEAFVAQHLALTLGVQGRPGSSFEQAVCDGLRFKKMLLVLDNCEHVLDACVSLCDHLLNQCAHVTILATSREPLRIVGEEAWRTPPLEYPEANQTYSPADLALYSAVQLFVERASTTQAPLIVDSTNASAIAAICRYLAGLPLAIELAAAWVNRRGAGSVHEIATSLNQSLSKLTFGSQASRGRQQTLTATIDWSYQLLTPVEQRLFLRLSVFQDFTAEAAQEVCTDEALSPPVLQEALLALVEKSLVERNASLPVVRYRLLTPIREFARSLLTDAATPPMSPADGEREVELPDERTRLQRRQGEYLLHLARQAEPHLIGSQQIEWLDRLQAEAANFHGFLDWTLRNGETSLGLRLAGTLWRFWYVRGYHQEGLSLLQRLLDTRPEVSTADRVKALNGAGNIAYVQADYATARRLYEESLELKTELGDPKSIHTGMASLANALAGEEDYVRAEALMEQCLEFFQATNDTRNIAATLANLGQIAHKQQNYPKARAYHEQSLTLLREMGDLQNVALALNNLAGTLLNLNDDRVARTLLKECLSLCRRIEAKHRFIYCLVNYVTLFIHLNQKEQAATIYGALEALCQKHRLLLPDRAGQELQEQMDALRKDLGEVEFSVRMTQGQTMTETAIEDYLVS